MDVLSRPNAADNRLFQPSTRCIVVFSPVCPGTTSLPERTDEAVCLPHHRHEIRIRIQKRRGNEKGRIGIKQSEDTEPGQFHLSSACMSGMEPRTDCGAYIVEVGKQSVTL